MVKRARSLKDIFGNDGQIIIKEDELLLVDIDSLLSHPKHNFKLHTGVKMQKMIESVECAGVLQPIIVSQRKEGLYILAGYNRVHASRCADKMQIPAIIKKNLSNLQEIQIINFTNFFQAGTEYYKYSERVRAYKSEYDALVASRERYDEKFEYKTTREYFAGLYEMTDSKMNRYLTLAKLTDELLECLDEGIITLVSAIEFAGLNKKTQKQIYSQLDITKRISTKEATSIKKAILNEIDDIKKINQVEAKPVNIKLNYEVYSCLPKGKERTEVVENSIDFTQNKLPDWFFNHNIDIGNRNMSDYVIEILNKVHQQCPDILQL